MTNVKNVVYINRMNPHRGFNAVGAELSHITQLLSHLTSSLTSASEQHKFWRSVMYF